MGGDGGTARGRWWTVKEFAAEVRRHPETVRRWIREGRLMAVQPVGKGPQLLPDPSSALVTRSRRRRR